MSRGYIALLAVLTLSAGQPTAEAASGLFPPDVLAAGGGHGFTDRLDETPLWRSRGQTERIRLFVGGFTLRSWSVRLEQSRDGRWTGFLREHTGRRLNPERRFKVSAAEMAELRALIARSGLWEIYPQFWNEDPDDFCLDGVTVIFERVDASGYRYAQGNSPCTLGRDQLAVAARIMHLAGEPKVAGFFE